MSSRYHHTGRPRSVVPAANAHRNRIARPSDNDAAASDYGRANRVNYALVSVLGVERDWTVRHRADGAGPAHGRGRLAAQGVRLLAQAGRVATGNVAGTAVARNRGTPASTADTGGGHRTTLEASRTVPRRPTSECRPPPNVI